MRSFTAETIYSSDTRHLAKSAGTSLHARVKLTGELIRWADIIFPMEKKHEEFIRETFPDESVTKKIICLDIPDTYYFMEPALVELIKARTAPYLEEDQP
jgi:predicted protein tyrosine phosphatase